MNSMIPFLKKGDKIQLVSPAKAIEPMLVFDAKAYLEKQGFVIILGQYTMSTYNYFAGNDQERLQDFQDAIDDPEIKAIVCARGGYGSIRILDQLDWTKFSVNKKWIIGFSDITVFHLFLQSKDIPSIHATMPLNYSKNSPKSLKSLIDSFTGKLKNYEIKSSKENILGKAKGKLFGGNLSIVYSLLGTKDFPKSKNNILFIEDLSEQVYHIDRMFFSLKKSGVLSSLSGLIVGSFTEIKNTEIPFGKSYKEIILEHTKDLNIPVVFDFPAGHIDDNRALIFGTEITLNVEKNQIKLEFENNNSIQTL
jgi:muramoyltetrapeptide carboxypeptidase